jgi:hypothetical protein
VSDHRAISTGDGPFTTRMILDSLSSLFLDTPRPWSGADECDTARGSLYNIAKHPTLISRCTLRLSNNCGNMIAIEQGLGTALRSQQPFSSAMALEGPSQSQVPNTVNTHTDAFAMDIASFDVKKGESEKPHSHRQHQHFPFKLYDMLEYSSNSSEFSSVASWNPDGSFVIIDQDALMESVAPSFFKQTKYRSFVSCGCDL